MFKVANAAIPEALNPTAFRWPNAPANCVSTPLPLPPYAFEFLIVRLLVHEAAGFFVPLGPVILAHGFCLKLRPSPHGTNSSVIPYGFVDCHFMSPLHKLPMQ